MARRQPMHLDLLKPRTWPLLLVVGAGRFVGQFPLSSMGRLSKPLAWLLLRSRRIRTITRANLEACFPELTDTQLQDLTTDATHEVARSICETLKVWFSYSETNPHFDCVSYTGLENLDTALSRDCGIILLCSHFGALDLNGAFFARLNRKGRRFVGVYRKPSDPSADAIIQWGRTKMLDRAIPIQSPREVMKELSAGSIVWMAPDIEVRGPGAVYADFFGQPAGTTTWPARIASNTGAVVLPASHSRLKDGSGYRFEIRPPLEGFPSGDETADARTINLFVETVVAPDPAPYWWCIKRFKWRPEGAKPIY